MPVSVHAGFSSAREGIYLFEDFLNVTFNDKLYTEYETYVMWKNAWEQEIE